VAESFDYENEERDPKLIAEYDASFSGEEKISSILKLTSDSYTREIKRIKIKEIGFTDPVKKGRAETMTGLTSIIKDLGVLDPIDVMTVEDPDDDYKYVLITGLRRVFGALKNGIEEIDAIVWDFKDKDRGNDLALYLGLLLNKRQKRNYGEIWHLYQVLELQSSITPGTLEYLLELESGDAMKLKDVMLCEYDEVKEALLSGEKNLDGAYKLLSKLRKEEDKLAMEDATGVSDSIEGAEDISSDNRGEGKELSDQDVMELLEMVDSVDEDVTEADFDDLNKGVDERQVVGERHPLDPALKSAVLSRDNFRCKCCGFGGAAALGILAVHHVIPVHCSGKDELGNLTTLCLNHHILLHVAERNGGKLQMTKEEFDGYSEDEQLALKKCLKLAKIAVEADKRRNMSLEDVRKATTESIRHPMPGAGLKEAQAAYATAKYKDDESSEE
jgi:5-methylcytosine-specific restriction protein A